MVVRVQVVRESIQLKRELLTQKAEQVSIEAQEL